MNVLILSLEFPYPPNHGGRVDIWNRVLSFKKSNCNVFLITWAEVIKGDKPSEADISYVRSQVDHLEIFSIKRDFLRILDLLKYPSLIAARRLDASDYTALLDKVILFKPDFVFIETLYSAHLGLKIANSLSIPSYIRQQNIEHLYFEGQLKANKNFRNKISIFASLLHLKKFEFYALGKADAFFDISITDLNFWKDNGFSNGKWLPPSYVGNNESLYDPNFEFMYDVGFLGNLYTPNNVSGLTWFIENVYPKLVAELPLIKILFAGSNPSTYLKEIVVKCPNISIVANPDDLKVLYKSAKVLINPVQFSSGVNIKSIEMLFAGNPVVSTSHGVKGLPEDFHEVFKISDSTHEFANHILNAIVNNNDFRDNDLLTTLKNYFKPEFLLNYFSNKVLDDMQFKA